MEEIEAVPWPEWDEDGPDYVPGKSPKSKPKKKVGRPKKAKTPAK